MDLKDINFDAILAPIVAFVGEYGLRVLGAIVVWIIGSVIIKKLTHILCKILDKRSGDLSLKTFFKSLIGIVLKILLVITVLSMLGVEMTSFIALLGAAGLAVGMALSGTLQNFAGGVIILIFKPFRVGDYVSAQGYEGVVKEIQIFNTILTTLDNKTVIIPNGGLSTSSLTNYSTEEFRRIDFTFGIGYGDSVEKARAVVLDIVKETPKVLNQPQPPFIAVSALADSSVNLAVRVWVKGTDYWEVFFDINEKVYNGFNKAGVNIPFPQMDVHLHKEV